MGAHLYDNRDTGRRELHINGEPFACAGWDWIDTVVRPRGKDDWLWQRWHPQHRWGHYPQPPEYGAGREAGGDTAGIETK